MACVNLYKQKLNTKKKIKIKMRLIIDNRFLFEFEQSLLLLLLKTIVRILNFVFKLFKIKIFFLLLAALQLIILNAHNNNIL